MDKLKSNIFETALATLILLSIILFGFYFYSILYPDTTEDNPFSAFDNNSGIIKISIASFLTRTIFVFCFVLLSLDTYRQEKKILAIYLLSALSIGFLQWYELYYGSTFYYGEVRDKQGLSFPIFSSCMATLVIWKLDYFTNDNRNLTIKVIMTGFVNAGLYFLWTKVYEPWNLWQS